MARAVGQSVPAATVPVTVPVAGAIAVPRAIAPD
jgi:hypothetical protein